MVTPLSMAKSLSVSNWVKITQLKNNGRISVGAGLNTSIYFSQRRQERKGIFFNLWASSGRAVINVFQYTKQFQHDTKTESDYHYFIFSSEFFGEFNGSMDTNQWTGGREYHLYRGGRSSYVCGYCGFRDLQIHKQWRKLESLLL